MKPALHNYPGLNQGLKHSLKRGRPRQWLIAALIGLLLSASSWSVELGSPSIRSFLGQSLDVRINVVDGTDENMQGALVSLAPVSEWVRAGISLLPDDVTLQVSFVKEGENIFVTLRSQQPIREPVLQILLSFQVTGQQVASKPFILFLDPPPGASNQARTISSGNTSARFNREAASTSNTGAANNNVLGNNASNRTASAPVRSTPARRDPRVDLEGNRYGPVREGETLWGIAERISRQVDFSPQQILIALQQANPNALEDPGNVNTLRSGVTLTLPDTSSLARTDREQALALIEEQNRQWRDGGRGARLELVRGGEDSSLGIDGGDSVLALRISRLEEDLMATRRENVALREQVGQLEGSLIERESEISLSNQALADMERRLSEARNQQASGRSAALSSSGDDGLGLSADIDTSSVEVTGDEGSTLQNSNEASNTSSTDFGTDANLNTALAQNTDDALFSGDVDNVLQTENEQDSGSLTTRAQNSEDIGPTSNQGNNTSSNTQPASASETPSARETVTGPPPRSRTNAARWTWPVWESDGWRDWQRQYGWLPRGATGFWLLAAILLTILALPFIAWILLRRGNQPPAEEPSDLLDRLVTQSQSRKTSADKSVETGTASGALATAALASDDEQGSKSDSHEAFDADLEDWDLDDELELKPEIVEGIDWDKAPAYVESGNDSDVDVEQDDIKDSDGELEADDSDDIDNWSEDDELDIDDGSLFDEMDDDDLDDEMGSDELQSGAEVLVFDDQDDDLDLEAALGEALNDDAEMDDPGDAENDPVFSGDDNDSVTSDKVDPELPESDDDLSLDDLDELTDEGIAASLNDGLDDELNDDSISLESMQDDDRSLDDINAEGVDESVQGDTAPDDVDQVGDVEPLGLSDADRAWSKRSDNQTEEQGVVSTSDLSDDSAGEQIDAAPAGPEQLSEQSVEDQTSSKKLDDPFAASLQDEPASNDNPDEPVQSSLYGDDSIDVKLDLARAYLAMGDREAMLTILDEIGDAGTEQQQQEVQTMRGSN